MANNKLLEKYHDNLDKALGLIDNTDDVDLDGELQYDKNYLYMLLGNFMDKVENKINGGK